MSRWMMDRCSDGDAVHLWESSCCDASSTTCVPVAVVDFGNPAEVIRLRLACPDDWAFEYDKETHAEVNAHLVAALREFANPTPPKPAEPTGLGAVVVDRDGSTLVRVDNSTHPWRASGGGRFGWDDVDHLTTLNEGIEPMADWEIDLLRGAE